MFLILGTNILQQTLAIKERNILFSQPLQTWFSFPDTLGEKLSYSDFLISRTLEGSSSLSKPNLSEKHIHIYNSHIIISTIFIHDIALAISVTFTQLGAWFSSYLILVSLYFSWVLNSGDTTQKKGRDVLNMLNIYYQPHCGSGITPILCRKFRMNGVTHLKRSKPRLDIPIFPALSK